ncbi:MAG: NAD(P) transhydrogenase subunit alpha, partial [Myxococcota bacterium]
VDEMLGEKGVADSFTVDTDDVVVRAALVSHAGEVTWPPPAPPEPTPITPKLAPQPVVTSVAPKKAAEPKRPGLLTAAFGLALLGLWIYLRATVEPGADDAATRAFVQHLTVFVLACFVGWQVIWSVSAALHTPLMSVTNAISGIIIVGGLLEGGHGSEMTASVVLGLLATFLATLNIAGGFLVTQRMLNMFRKR